MCSTKISIIVPIYNVEQYLQKTIESCINQTLKELEVILVDDGSKDASGKVVDDFAKKDNRIKVIHKQNEGVTIARNTGLAVATGKYIFFLDGDDYLPLNAMDLLYQKAIEEDADWVIGDYILKYPNSREVYRSFFDFGIADSESFLRYCFSQRDFYFTGRLIKRKFITEANVFIPSEITFGEDNVAVVQLALQLKKAIKVNHPVLYYVQRDSSVPNRLEKKDLIQRANACLLIHECITKDKIYSFIKQEYAFFLQKEICDSISRGYINSKLLDLVKDNDLSVCSDLLSRFEKILVMAAKICPYATVRLFAFLKEVKRIFIA